MPKKGISGRKRKNRNRACVHSFLLTISYLLFCTGADRHSGILMPLLLLFAETKRILIKR